MRFGYPQPSYRFQAISVFGRYIVCTALLALLNPSLADESLDFDVDQLIANEKAWAEESESSSFPTRSIAVKLLGLSSNKGVVHILAYDDQLAFQSGDFQRAVGYIKTKAVRGTLSVTLDVASGNEIALFAYQDENNDEFLNKRNQIPEEPYGFSGGSNPYLQPRFSDAAFVEDEITIRLISLPRR